ncbi:hypothetical protein K1719_039080 [Acacia pycnantha]|nr:hypothetical protein K1719_039080 [Acacia pycnantha]
MLQKDPGEHSRLWFHEDVLDVLTEHTGTKAIEGISLKVQGTHRERLVDSEAFKEMKKLRLLQLDYVNLKGDYKHLSKKLRWLCWKGFPLKYTPNNFSQKELVAIDFKYSNLRVVWKDPQLLEMLKTLNLSHSSYLTQTSLMKDCPSLMLVHQSIGDLKRIHHLVNFKDCKCLRALPRSMYKLKSLNTLILSGCSLIDHLEEDVEQMESMTVLKADNTAITTIPKSLARLKGLKHGYVSFPGLEGRAQDIFPSLICFHGLSPFLGDLAKLRGMWEECRPLFRFHGTMARLLDALYETNFMKLESTRDTPQISYTEASASCERHEIARPANSFNSLLLRMGVCSKADLLQEKISQGWNYGGCDDSNLPVYSSCMDNTTPHFLINVLIINHTKKTVKEHWGVWQSFHEDEEWLSIISSVQPGDLIELVLSIGPQLVVNKIAAYLIYDGSSEMVVA